MTSLPSTVQTSLGRTLHLSKQIGKGGEGAIYETREQNEIAVKLYWPNKAQSRRDKIAAMASAQFYKTNSFVAFPIDVLCAPNGEFAGFVMKKIGASKPVHMLYSPASRKVEFSKANYKFLIRAAGNIARAVASVHACGCVIGDINHSGFLVSDKATSVLIDSDSFQVVAANKRYLCQVGTPEYTPPELQGARFDRVTRTPNHDNFGLAILLFQLLFMGRHPFSGRYQGSGDMPLERAIGEHRFAYSTHTSVTNMKPPPSAPLLTDFPLEIGQAFENAFGRAGRSKRPSATEWISLLDGLEKALVVCASDSNHQHVKGRPCPWCRMEQSSPGFIAFTPNVADISIHVDVAQLVAILKAIRNPGPTPEIQTAIVVPTAAPAAPSLALISTLKTRAYIGIGASAAGAILIFFGGIATVPGLAALGAGLVANIAVPKELKQLREARSQAEASWLGIQDAWTKQPGNANFLEKKAQADALIAALNDLPNEEKRQIHVLDNNKRAAQLYRYLDRYLIANTKIRKIGSGRKAVLASFGIETAADIDRSKILTIQGFGPGLVAELVAWRQGLANRFVYNASEPINPSDLLALKTRLATRKAELERAIRALAASLQQDSASSLGHRAKLITLANQAFAARKQAEANEQAATGSLYKASKFISLCCAGLAAIGLLRDSGSMNARLSNDKPTVTASVPEKPIANSKIPSAASATVPPATASEPPVEPSGSVGQDSAEAPPSKPVSPPSPTAPMTLPTQAVPQTPTAATDAPSNDTAEIRSAVKSALQIQQRLVELGYLSSSAADGKWGLQSRRALSEYKRQAGLNLDDARDAATEQSLFSDNAPRAVRTLLFVGGWSLEPGRCGDPGQPPPVRITATRAETSGGSCIFNSVRPDGHAAWRIEASCSSGGATRIAHVRLAVNGPVLQWKSEQPEVRYYRCPASQ
jgi:DNA-binding helix-hairpin-helix protein with protein kinase domain